MTCVIEENACAYICEISAEARKQQLKQLIRGEDVPFNNKCPKVARINDIVYSPSKPRNTNGTICNIEILRYLILITAFFCRKTRIFKCWIVYLNSRFFVHFHSLWSNFYNTVSL